MNRLRRHLGWKLFLSYLVIILVGVSSLAIVAEFVSPTAFNRHVATMEAMMGPGMDGMMTDLTENFQRAVNEILLVAALLATLTAVIISTLITRRIVRPVRQMQLASRRIAGGRYEERVSVTGEDELAELGLAFNAMATELEQTEMQRRQLIGDVAHELRTPLAGIQGVMEGLQDGVLPPELATFHSVEREVARLQRLVQDLEALSQAEAGQVSLDFAEVAPAAFLWPTIERLQLQYEEKGVALLTGFADDPLTVRADAARMTQVMLNLLGNALQYTPEGQQVCVSLSADGYNVRIAVQDSGIGLAADDLPRIFERFYRVDRSRSRVGGGSGVGLTISRHLVEAHGGTLAATSEGPGRGSTFTITLPRVY